MEAKTIVRHLEATRRILLKLSHRVVSLVTIRSQEQVALYSAETNLALILKAVYLVDQLVKGQAKELVKVVYLEARLINQMAVEVLKQYKSLEILLLMAEVAAISLVATLLIVELEGAYLVTMVLIMEAKEAYT
eukprot:UN13241